MDLMYVLVHKVDFNIMIIDYIIIKGAIIGKPNGSSHMQQSIILRAPRLL